MKLSILVPVYNEEKTIGKILAILASLKLPCQREIIVVDDGSNDKTSVYLRKIAAENNLVCNIRHKFNKGKGKAVQTGINASSGDYVLIQDADLEYNPSEIKNMLKPIFERRKTGLRFAVYGTRFKNGRPAISFAYYLGNKFLTLVTNILFQTNLTDMETGYKLLPRSFLKSVKLTSSRFDIEPEITAKLIKAKIPIIEVPISYKGRSHLAGKKLTLTDAFGAIKTLLYFRLVH